MKSFFDPSMPFIKEILRSCATFGEIAQCVKEDEYELMLACFDRKSTDFSLARKIMDFHGEYFKSYNSLNKVELIERYTCWLNGCYDSLKFTWNDMAEHTGISRTLLKQYYNGLSSPLTAKNAKGGDIHSRIFDYIMSLYTCDTDASDPCAKPAADRYKFIRLPNKMFGDFLRELLSAFSYTINQSQLAERIGLSQGKISRIVNGSYTITTQMQYDILKIFNQFCDAHYEVYSPLYFIASRLKKYLFIESYDEPCFNYDLTPEDNKIIEQELFDERVESTKESRLLIFRFLRYPDNVQKMILQCSNIFSNDIYEISSEHFDRFMQLIRTYRKNRSDPQKTAELFSSLNEKYNAMLVFDSTGNDLFDTMADYLKITEYTRRNGPLLGASAEKKLLPLEEFCETVDPDISKLSNDNKTGANRFIHIFRKELLLPVSCFEEMLRFTAEEWEICRLLTLEAYSAGQFRLFGESL